MRARSISSILLAAALLGACLGAEERRLGLPEGGSPLSEPAPGVALALFAGGCFWSVELAFEKTYGVLGAVSGYAGGEGDSPSYEDYAERGFVEAVQVYYDPSRVSYGGLLEVYWRSVDPTDGRGSFYDRGPSYRPILYYGSEAERAEAEASKRALGASGRFIVPIAASVEPAPAFWPAEGYHQDYARRNPEAYEAYRVGSGRAAYFPRIWGEDLPPSGAPPGAPEGGYRKPPEAELRARLSPLQFEVTQREGTEPPYRNELLDEHREGLFVDIVSGEPLFSSRDKYESGTGWPSFTRPLVPANIVALLDTSLGMERIEIRSRWADSHLGHLFEDGPEPTGLRYCMNSASLRFIPKAEMAREGYAAYLRYFP